MTLLTGNNENAGDTPQSGKLQEAESHFNTIKSLLFNIADQVSEQMMQVIDAKLTSRQQALIVELTSKDTRYRPWLRMSENGVAGSRELQEWLEALQLTHHGSIVSAWCDEQGAISLSEITENLADLITDLGTSLSPSDCSKFLSPLAVEAAEMVTLHSLSEEVTELVDVALAELDRGTFEGILSKMSSEQQALLLARQQVIAKKIQLCKPSDCGPESPLNRSGVRLSSAANISKRDEKLLRNLGSYTQNSDRCEGCGENMKASEGQVCNEDGCLYCERCWRDWLPVAVDTGAAEIVSSFGKRSERVLIGAA
jgi:hypothetical protein